LTGVPAILNTSFNNNAEPIVDSVDDAVACFLTTGIDFLVVGDMLVRRRDNVDLATAVGRLRPRLPQSRKLLARPSDDGSEPYTFFVESTASHHFVEPSQAISADTYRLLVRANGRFRADELLTLGAMKYAKCRASVLQELLALWESRSVVLRP
jgi:carbamoyltransferase